MFFLSKMYILLTEKRRNAENKTNLSRLKPEEVNIPVLLTQLISFLSLLYCIWG